jgi:hypothetical protein
VGWVGNGDTHFAVIVLLALVGLDGTDDIACILDHHLTCINVSFTEETPTVDGRPRAQKWKRAEVNFQVRVIV